MGRKQKTSVIENAVFILLNRLWRYFAIAHSLGEVVILTSRLQVLYGSLLAARRGHLCRR